MTVTNCNNQDYISSHGWTAVKSKFEHMLTSTDFADIFHKTLWCPQQSQFHCSLLQLEETSVQWQTDSPVCEWMDAHGILLLTGTLQLCVLYLFPNTVSLVTTPTVNTRTSVLKVGMWLISECMIGWLWLSKSANVKEEICANSLTDRFAWRASATNHKRKTERQFQDK